MFEVKCFYVWYIVSVYQMRVIIIYQFGLQFIFEFITLFGGMLYFNWLGLGYSYILRDNVDSYTEQGLQEGQDESVRSRDEEIIVGNQVRNDGEDRGIGVEEQVLCFW